MNLDLHTHSTASDGSCTPAELVRMAAAQDIRLLALTDHDTIDGVEEAAAEADKTGIRFLAGIELQIDHRGGEFHLLGLGLKGDLSAFRQKLLGLVRDREDRNKKMLQKINAAGINLSLADLEAEAGGRIIGRPHFARALVKKGVAPHTADAFRLYLGTGKTFYIPIKTPTLEEGIALIKNAGGITVMAHPVSLNLPPRKLKEFLRQCRKQGLDGIEIFHPDMSLKLSRDLERFAMYNKFIITGGSDFHGTNRSERKLGFYGENLRIPLSAAKFFV